MPNRDAPDTLSLRAHRLWIGGLGLALPLVLPLVDCFRPTPELGPWHLLDSISAYYYTGAVSLFTGILFALSLFLINYRAYKQASADRVVGRIGGAGAFVVALFPCEPPTCTLQLHWWCKCMGYLHYAGATVLFASFVVFSTWLFRKSDEPNPEKRPPEKRLRDAISLACGIAIALSMVAAALLHNGSIFLPESIAIVAFAVSWILKALGSDRGTLPDPSV